MSTGFVRYTSALQTGVRRIQRPRRTRYPLVPYPIPPAPRRPHTGQPPSIGTWADTGRAIDRTPPTRTECNRDRGVCGRYRPAPVTGRSTVRMAHEPQPRALHRVCRWWAWNRPYQREATPSLPIESLRDWRSNRDDAGILDDVDCVGFVCFIPALKEDAFASNFP